MALEYHQLLPKGMGIPHTIVLLAYSANDVQDEPDLISKVTSNPDGGGAKVGDTIFVEATLAGGSYFKIAGWHFARTSFFLYFWVHGCQLLVSDAVHRTHVGTIQGSWGCCSLAKSSGASRGRCSCNVCRD
jgi:hypothetical protein